MAGSRVWRAMLAGGVLVGGTLLLLLPLVPSPVEPVAWNPPERPALTGPLAPDDRLVPLERWPLQRGRGPEDVARGPRGAVYAGVEDGRVVRWRPGAASPEDFASTGGRPLGLAFAPDGDLVVADARKGLLGIDADGTVSILATGPDVPLGYANGVGVAPDGTIYFTNPSGRLPARRRLLSLLSGRRDGRLLAYDPVTGAVRTVMDSLHHPNGVALDPEGRFVLVAETGRYRVWRHWLTGPRAGRSEVLVPNLPGFPDGISIGGDGELWIAVVALRSRVVDALAPHPGLRKLLAAVTEVWRPAWGGYGLVVKADSGGRLVGSLHDPGGGYGWISNAVPQDGRLYLGSIRESSVGRVPQGRALRPGCSRPVSRREDFGGTR